MYKKILIILMFIILIRGTSVNALVLQYFDKNLTIDATSRKEAVLLCTYGSGKHATNIYYHYDYTKSDSTNNPTISSKKINFLPYHGDEFIDEIYYRGFEKYPENFKCEPFAYYDYGIFGDVGNNKKGVNKIDISHTENTTDGYDEGDKLNYSIFEDIDLFMNNDVYSKITDENIIELSNTPGGLVISKTKEFFQQMYIKDGYKLPSFINNYIENHGQNEDKLAEEFSIRWHNVINNSDLTEEEKKEKHQQMDTYTDNLKNPEVFDPLKPGSDISCDAMLTPKLTLIVKDILNFIRYMGPILLAVFTIKDFIVAATNGEKDSIKTGFSRFKTRLIFAILLFFLPNIVDLLLGIVGVFPADECLK